MDWQKTLAKFNKEKEFGDGKQTLIPFMVNVAFTLFHC